MPDFSPWPGGLPVVVKMGVWVAEHLTHGGDIADEVEHRRPPDWIAQPQWEAAYRAQVVLELAGTRSFDRPVPGVMHARGHLIRQEPTAFLKPLDR